MGPGGRRFESAHPDHAPHALAFALSHRRRYDVTVQQDNTILTDVDEEALEPARQMPLPIVISRIIVVSGMSFAAALAIFFLVGALWLPALAASGATVVFLVLMFAIERGAE